MKLTNLPPPSDAVNTAEELVIKCYLFGLTPESLNELHELSKRFEYILIFYSPFSFETKLSSICLYFLFIYSVLMASVRIKIDLERILL